MILPQDRDWETKSAHLRPEGEKEKEIVGLGSKQSVLCWFPPMSKKLPLPFLQPERTRDSYVNSLRPLSTFMCQCKIVACKQKRCEDAGFSCASQAGDYFRRFEVNGLLFRLLTLLFHDQRN